MTRRLRHTDGPLLQAYLLGLTEFDLAVGLQRRLVFEVSEDRGGGALLICEHQPLVTVGREGSRAQIRFERDELAERRWPVRWVNRGGGCNLHLPGQLAIYPIVALDRLALEVPAYLGRLSAVLRAVARDFGVEASFGRDRADLYADSRPLACAGIAVRDWVTYYGAYFNVNPDLAPYRRVLWTATAEPMTSLERQRHGPVRVARVRERLVEHFADVFGFAQTAIFFDHPALAPRTRSDALAARS